jgi:hypothetical protein
MIVRALTISFAIAITITSACIAGVAALDRGGTAVDQVLLVALSIIVTLMVHFLPSFTKRKLVMIAWALCLVAAIFNHLIFFVHSAERAEESRETKTENSIKVRGLSDRIADVSHEYYSITSRSLPAISQQLATEVNWKIRSALKIEQSEAMRKIILTNQLGALKSELAKIREMAGSDVVSSELSFISGISRVTVNLSTGLLFALLLEVLGAILWYETFHGITAKTKIEKEADAEVKASERVHKHSLVDSPIMTIDKDELSDSFKVEKTPKSNDKDVNEILLAINNGRCRATADSIRKLMKCRTSRAAELNRMVKEVMKVPGTAN